MPPRAPQTPTTFPLFPQLPSELRIKIWREACSSRTLSLTYSSEDDLFTCSSPAPAILSVSHEARHEAKQIYTLSFSTATHPARTYFNPYRDTLHLPRHREMGYDETLRDFRNLVQDEGDLLDQVRSIAIDHVHPHFKRPWESYNKAALLRSFRHLDETVLVLGGNGDMACSSTDISPYVEVELREPKKDPERLLRIWAYFRQSFVAEERLLEEVCRESGRDYEAFSLPVVKIKMKALKEVAPVRTEVRGIASILARLRLSAM